MTTIDLTGKTALVTGGSIGIGREIALELARAGADVVITYLSHPAEEVVAQVKELGRQAAAFKLDAINSAEVDQVTGAAAQVLGGRIDILVNNAGGLVGRSTVAEMSNDHWHKVIDVNLSSAFYCSRAVLPFMTGGWGRIINISSVAAQNGGGPGAVAYATSKAGMIGLTKGLAKELASRAITVNAVAPGLILDTPFHETFTPPAAQKATIESIALKRPGYPPDVAGSVVFLASDLAGFVTGETISINGGAWFV
ncbi:MAG: 3-oxoacyl-ACP reductase FabG [Chloroflexi bacterium]|nr:3-oxoacyl-ACP reductase FabG [Chloroflexota bacterium]OJV99814.1 MAG: oxidoreductase [Chloroflexi bacterium 54-19]